MFILHWSNWQSVDKKLKLLQAGLANKITRKAMRAAAKVLQKAIQKVTPKATGQTRRAIKVRAAKRKKGRIGVNVQIGAGSYKGETFYASFVNFGYRRGKKKVQVPPNEFMKKGTARGGKDAIRAARQVFVYEIDRAVA